MSHIPTGRKRYVFNPKTGRLEEVVPKDNLFHWLSLLPASYAKPPATDEVFEVKRALARLGKLEDDDNRYELEARPVIRIEDVKDESTPPITWHKLSEKKPPKEGVYLTWFAANPLYRDPPYQNVEAKRWGIQDSRSTEMSFFNLSITHWAEFNLPHEEKE